MSKEKANFLKQCLYMKKYLYTGEFRSNIYPYTPEKREVNFKDIKESSYKVSILENKFVIRIVDEDGDTKVIVPRIYF